MSQTVPQRSQGGRSGAIALARPPWLLSPRQTDTLARRLCHALAFLVPALLATNYTLNRFYELGAAMWDSGWFAHLATHGLRNPPAIGGLFLNDHMSLVLGLLALIHQLTPETAAPVHFAFTQGVWFGTIGLAASLCLMPHLPKPAALALALLAAMNGISLATIGFPHIEIAIPALILLMLALWVRGHRLASWLVLPLLLSVREDAGLHLATIFALIALWRWRHAGDGRAARGEALLAATAIAASLALLGVQEALFVTGEDQLHDTYLGEPALAHLSWQFVWHRIYRLGQNRSYIYLPFLLTLAVALRQRSWALALGPLAGIPWVALALIAKSHAAGELMSYYGFPLMIGLCWPMVAASRFFARPDPSIPLRLAASNVVLSIVLFAFSGGMHDRRPWESFGPPNLARIAATEAALDDITTHRATIGPFLIDDAVGALRPAAFTSGELRMLLAFTPAEIHAAESFIFHPFPWLTSRKNQIIAQAKLTHHYRLRGTPMFLFSRHNLDELAMLERME